MNKTILFICTDNFGRSIIAERAMRDYLARHNLPNIEVKSAGTNATSDTSQFSTTHFCELEKIGLDGSWPKRTQVTKEMIETSGAAIIFDNAQKV